MVHGDARVRILYDYLMQWVGKPYLWGKEGPDGFDCSGLAQEALRSVGMDPPGDQTAQALFNHFEKTAEWNRLGLGSLVFYGASVTQITHVAIMIDPYRVLEAGGGDSTCTTPEVAAKKGAFVRVRHLSHRKDRVAVLRPRYATIGLP